MRNSAPTSEINPTPPQTQNTEYITTRGAIEAVRELENDEFIDDFCEIIDLELSTHRDNHQFSRKHIKQIVLIEAFLTATELSATGDTDTTNQPYDTIAERAIETLTSTHDILHKYTQQPAPTQEKSVYTYEIPSRDELNEFIRRAQKGDKEAEATVVASCLRFVHARFIRDRIQHAPLSASQRRIANHNDLAQEAALALFSKIADFNNRDATFLTYVTPGMNQRSKRMLDANTSAMRIPDNTTITLRRAWAIAREENPLLTTEDEITRQAINNLVESEKPTLTKTPFTSRESYWQWAYAVHGNFLDSGAERLPLDDLFDYAPSHMSYLTEDEAGKAIELDSDHWLESLSDHDDYDAIDSDAPHTEIHALMHEARTSEIDAMHELVASGELLTKCYTYLSPQEKHLVDLLYGIGTDLPLSLQDIATAEGVSTTTIRDKLHQAFSKIRMANSLEEFIEWPRNSFENDSADRERYPRSFAPFETDEDERETYHRWATDTLERVRYFAINGSAEKILYSIATTWKADEIEELKKSLMLFAQYGSTLGLLSTELGHAAQRTLKRYQAKPEEMLMPDTPYQGDQISDNARYLELRSELLNVPPQDEKTVLTILGLLSLAQYDRLLVEWGTTLNQHIDKIKTSLANSSLQTAEQ